MKNSLRILTLASAILFTASSCDQAKEEAEKAKDKAAEMSGLTMDNFNEKAKESLAGIPDILTSVKDEASLDAASENMGAVKEKVDSLIAMAAKLPKPAGDKLAAMGDNLSKTLDEGLGEKMEGAWKHLKAFEEKNPALAEKIAKLKLMFREVTGKVRNIFDQDGAIGGKAE